MNLHSTHFKLTLVNNLQRAGFYSEVLDHTDDFMINILQSQGSTCTACMLLFLHLCNYQSWLWSLTDESKSISYHPKSVHFLVCFQSLKMKRIYDLTSVICAKPFVLFILGSIGCKSHIKVVSWADDRKRALGSTKSSNNRRGERRAIIYSYVVVK